ncbi:MAG: hypothetical protein ACOC8B_07560 [Gemmatimonadota bacterium]
MAARTKGTVPGAEPDADLRDRLTALYAEGREIWTRFDAETRRQAWHPFIPADYPSIERALLPLRAPGLSFLEWGSATGVITIMADLLGFDAYGIELDPELVTIARGLAERHGSDARFAAGSFIPAGYRWISPTGDHRLGTIGEGVDGYEELGRPLDSFDVVFGYPWDGEDVMMRDLFQRRGRTGARLMLRRGYDVEVSRRHPRAS